MILQELIALLRELDIEGASPGKVLEDDLGMDSQERLCLSEDIEQRFAVTFGDGELGGEQTVAALAALISRKQLPLPVATAFDGALVEDIVIAAPRGAVWQGLFDVAAWPRKLPHVVAIDINYDDGRYQEFTMDVDGADGRRISVRSVRRCAGDRITFFQPKPPVFLRHHCGEWFFRELDDGLTHLTTMHRWTLADGISAAEGTRIAGLLREHARLALDTWKGILETAAVKAPELEAVS
jgi:acyl carrier protein